MTEATVSTERMEAMLLRWGENNSSGRTVTFQLPEEGEHPFKGYPSGTKNGQRFILVVAPIDDNEENIPPEQAKRKKPFHELSRAQQAGILCNDPRFQRWCQDDDATVYNERDAEPADKAAHFVRRYCFAASRSALDRIPDCAARWDGLINRYHEDTQLPEQRV